MATATAVDYIVDPVTGFAGEYQSASQTVMLLSPESERGKVVPVATFVARNTDAQPLRCEPADFPQLSTRLREKVVALDFFLMLFDADIRTSTKVSIVQRLDELFAINEVRTHVLDIAYAAPLPATASFDFVVNDASSSHALDRAREIVLYQDLIRSLHVLWASMESDARVREIGYKRLTGLLIAASFFRETVLEVSTPGDITRILRTMDVRLRRDFDTQFLAEVMQGYLQTLTLDVTTISLLQSRPEKPAPASPRQRQEPLTNDATPMTPLDQLKNLTIMATIDGKVTEQEISLLIDRCSSLGLQEEDLEDAIAFALSGNAKMRLPTDLEQKRTFLAESMEMMAADGQLMEVEKQLFALAAAKMGIDKLELDTILKKLLNAP